MPVQVEEVLSFWFEELKPEDWYAVSAATDQVCAHRFNQTLERARLGELWQWRASALGRLAEIIVLDQFSRNIHRGSANAFAADQQALALAQEAVANADIDTLPPQQKQFLYMPYMHSESLLIHDEAVRLFSQPGLEHSLSFEHKHRDIILQFGRYPHRNALLGRPSTDAELAFLKTEGSSF